MSSKQSTKLWGGAFNKETDRAVEVFTASIGLDQRLWKVDIIASMAHAKMLGKCKIIPEEESVEIVSGLQAVLSDIELEKVDFDPNSEDIHSEIEKLLTQKIGAVAGKLHTARSRNDQVATDVRLYMRDKSKEFITELRSFQSWLVSESEKHYETVLPGLTHIQHAQPVSLAHHLMAYFWMFERDLERTQDTLKRINTMPLGSAALAGTPFPIDRQFTARELGFDRISENSLDAVSDRDHVVEMLSNLSLVMMHLSRLAEELCYWSTPEFGFIRLDDSVTTGSSIMPQKKNPDVAELIRGRVGRVYGALMGALTLLKSLPLSYNRDLQEDKAYLFVGIDATLSCVKMMKLILETATFCKDKMAASLAGDFSNATDLADYLVTKNLPFRQAHEVAGQVVKYCTEKSTQTGLSVGIEDLTLAELQLCSKLFESDVIHKLKPVEVMKARKSYGGTGIEAVKVQIQQAKNCLSQVSDYKY